MPSVEALQKKRAALVRKYNVRHASAQRHLANFVKAQNLANAINVEIALLDQALNGILDQRLTDLQAIQESSGEWGTVPALGTWKKDEIIDE
jgi:hypothetical protein